MPLDIDCSSTEILAKNSIDMKPVLIRTIVGCRLNLPKIRVFFRQSRNITPAVTKQAPELRYLCSKFRCSLDWCNAHSKAEKTVEFLFLLFLHAAVCQCHTLKELSHSIVRED